MTIGGEFVGRSGDLEMAPVVDPATQDVVGWAPVADEATVDAAVSAAAKAFGSWGPPRRRHAPSIWLGLPAGSGLTGRNCRGR